MAKKRLRRFYCAHLMPARKIVIQKMKKKNCHNHKPQVPLEAAQLTKSPGRANVYRIPSRYHPRYIPKDIYAKSVNLLGILPAASYDCHNHNLTIDKPFGLLYLVSTVLVLKRKEGLIL